MSRETGGGKGESISSQVYLSGEDASRILDHVLAACGMPPRTIPFEVLEERVRERKEKWT